MMLVDKKGCATLLVKVITSEKTWFLFVDENDYEEVYNFFNTCIASFNAVIAE